MPVRKNVFFDPKFNEWLYDTIVHLTVEQKSVLNKTELNKIRNSTAIKRFVANENLEKKLTFLTKVGIQWGMMFYKTPEITKDVMKKAYRQYAKPDTAVSVIDQMADTKTFVIHARDVAMCLATMSNDCHSEAYIINPRFYSFRKGMKGQHANICMKEDLAMRNANIQHDDAARASTEIARMMSETLTLDDYLSAVHGLQRLDLMILLFLYQHRHTYVSVDYLKRNMVGVYRPASIGVRCAFLFRELRMVDKRPAEERVQTYMITQTGILKVGEILNYLLKQVYG